MATMADVSRAAVLCASVPSVSGSVVAKPRVSVAASPFFNQGVKSLSATVSSVRSSVVNGSPLVVNMAKREEELVGIRKMSDEDINQTVVDLKGELFILRSKQATRQEFKSSEFRRIRKNIARMMTVKREREIERGVGIRESRKLDREWKRNIVIRPPPSYAASLAEQEKK
ncbi:hypothetical protein KC19_10G140000 [Ceratodon purpureus]|uniref:Large ribosomal subunit protein uL29c n=1 Tax=Ceratodon purpureus TaxID=3225 RepID=A0A8T0GMX5_CERPU|nr:hypothetical protein KC19_10G140000 [Ceratodon purpureus]